MLRYSIGRLFAAVPTLFVLVTLAFFMMRAAPGGPFDSEHLLQPEIRANLDRMYHLDEPLFTQYTRYLGNLVRGDLGPSFKYQDWTVNELIAAGLPVSLLLGGLAMLVALLAGFSAGAFAALRQNSAGDHAVMGIAMTGISVPTFVTAPLLILIFAVYAGILPAGGWNGGAWRNLVLPVAVLALPQVAYIARLTRGAMIEVLRSDYIRTARAKGLSTRAIVLRHALKPSLLPVLSYLGPAVAAVLTGSLVVEQIFGLPGIGRYFIQGALNRDYTLVMGVVVFYGAFVIAMNLVVDLLYALLDPQVRYR
jgi:oligopeptide transport system permease protein